MAKMSQPASDKPQRESGIPLGAGHQLGAAELLKPVAWAGHAELLHGPRAS